MHNLLRTAWRILHWFLRLPFKFFGLEEEELPCPICDTPMQLGRDTLMYCPACGYKGANAWVP